MQLQGILKGAYRVGAESYSQSIVDGSIYSAGETFRTSEPEKPMSPAFKAATIFSNSQRGNRDWDEGEGKKQTEGNIRTIRGMSEPRQPLSPAFKNYDVSQRLAGGGEGLG